MNKNSKKCIEKAENEATVCCSDCQEHNFSLRKVEKEEGFHIDTISIDYSFCCTKHHFTGHVQGGTPHYNNDRMPQTPSFTLPVESDSPQTQLSMFRYLHQRKLKKAQQQAKEEEHKTEEEEERPAETVRKMRKTDLVDEFMAILSRKKTV